MTAAPARTGAVALLEFARTRGIDYLFASPIAVLAPLWEAIAARAERGEPETPRYLNCRHELLAVSVASGYTKASGRPQVVLLPTGLGVLNGAMGLRSALQERTPMVVVSPDTLTYGAESAVDPGPEWPSLLVDLAGPARAGEVAVKWAREVKTAGDLPAELRRALYVAASVPRGPALLQVPFDVLLADVPPLDETPIEPVPVVAPGAQLDAVASLLVGAANPVVVTEHGARTDAARAALVRLSESLSAPVCEFMNPACENFPRRHPLYSHAPVETLLADADAILVAGCNAPWHPPTAPLRRDVRVVVLEEDPLRPRAPFWGYRTDIAVAGEVSANLIALAERVAALRPSPDAVRRARVERGNRERREALDAAAARETGSGVHATRLFTALREALPAGAAVVDEIIAPLPHMLRTLFSDQPLRHIRGWVGGLGTGVGTALGVKLALPDSVVVCVVGDGAFHYTPIPAAFGLAQQYGIPILVVVCDNRGFESQTWNVKRYFPHGSAVRTGNWVGQPITPTPDYAKLAEAYGGYGERVQTAADLAPALARARGALGEGRLALLDVFTYP
jgi:acetolactate synthase-1/2/3 large subunit